MASSDARPVPRKNVAYRVVFPIFDKTGALVTGAASLDSEISKDQGTFADCTNEATEIATSSGIYYLDLTSTEMNADCVAIIVKSTTTDVRTTVLVLYPEEAGDYRVDIVQVGGTNVTATGGRMEVNTTHFNGTAATASGGRPEVNTTHFGGSSLTQSGGRPEVNTTHAAGTAWASGAITASSIASSAITNAKFASGAIDAAAIAPNAIGASELASDAVAEIQSGLALAADLATVAGYIDTEVAAILAAVDTEVAAIKAKTDNLPASPAAVGDIPSAATIASAVTGSTIEGSYTLLQMLRLFAAVLLGKATGLDTGSPVYRNTGDSKDRVSATTDTHGNRSSVTLDAS